LPGNGSAMPCRGFPVHLAQAVPDTELPQLMEIRALPTPALQMRARGTTRPLGVDHRKTRQRGEVRIDAHVLLGARPVRPQPQTGGRHHTQLAIAKPRQGALDGANRIVQPGSPPRRQLQMAGHPGCRPVARMMVVYPESATPSSGKAKMQTDGTLA